MYEYILGCEMSGRNTMACPSTVNTGAKVCVSTDDICDGTQDCPNGEDESVWLCEVVMSSLVIAF